MSADFEKVLVKDPRLDVSDSIKYSVIKGGQNVTASPFNAISASNSQIVFNIQVPSEQTIIDRRVLLQTELNLTLNFVDPAGWYAYNFASQFAGPGTPVVGANPPADSAQSVVVPNNAHGGFQITRATGSCYGVGSALAPFPLHQLMTVMSATINNNTVSINIRDVLPAMIRMLDLDDLVSWNNSTPTYLDTFSSYTSSYGTLNNPHSGYWAVHDPRMVHRGCFVPTAFETTITPATGNVPTSGTVTTAPAIITERWSWQLTEPLLLSPFIFAHLKSNGQGFYGIQNLNFVFNIGDTSRVFRGFSGPPIGGLENLPTYLNNSPAPNGVPYLCNANGTTVINNNATPAVPFTFSGAGVVAGWSGAGAKSLFTLGSTRLLFNFLTPHPSDLMPARNIVPFYELPRYLSAGGTVDASATPPPTDGFNTPPQAVLTAGSGRLQTNSLQLNQIPDKLIIFVRKLASNQSYGDPDVALPISQVSINFNNMSGILASASTVQLWQMSRDNGCSNSWLDFSGAAMSYGLPNTQGYGSQSCPPPTGTYNNSQLYAAANPAAGTVTTALGYITKNGYVQRVYPTAGSYLCLEFGKDIQLTEDFYAPGSLGNFNLQVQLNLANYNNYAYNSSSPVEIVLITMNSGVFVCERGTSSTYTGILTKQDVLEASQQDHYTHDDVNRIVGGGFFGALKSAASRLAPMARQAASAVGNAAMSHGRQFVEGQVAKHAPALQATAERHLGNLRNQAEGAISGAVGRATGNSSSSRRSSRRRGRGLDEHC